MKPKTKNKFWFDEKRLVLIVMTILILFWLSINTIVIVNPGERGILLEFGRLTGVVYGEGLHFKTPLAQSVDIIDIKTQKLRVEASAASSDLQIVTSMIALNYRVKPDGVSYLRQTVGLDYQYKIIDPAIQEAVKYATAQFTAEELITKRAEAREQMRTNLQEKLNILSGSTLSIEEFNIENFEFSTEFDAAIEAKVTAEQMALKAERDLDRIKLEAEQKIAMAKAEAEAIIVQARALANKTEIINLRWIEKWDGRLPTYLGGGEGVLITLPSPSPSQ